MNISETGQDGVVVKAETCDDFLICIKDDQSYVGYTIKLPEFEPYDDNGFHISCTTALQISIDRIHAQAIVDQLQIVLAECDES